MKVLFLKRNTDIELSWEETRNAWDRWYKWAESSSIENIKLELRTSLIVHFFRFMQCIDHIDEIIFIFNTFKT